MFSAAVANHGTLMHPYLVQQVLGTGPVGDRAGQDVRAEPPDRQPWPVICSQMMNAVTHKPGGTAYATAGPQATGSIIIDGKTGTAENGINNGNPNDAVFTCFVPASDGRHRR